VVWKYDRPHHHTLIVQFHPQDELRGQRVHSPVRMNYWMQISQEKHTNGYLGTSPIFNLIEDRPFVAIRPRGGEYEKVTRGWWLGCWCKDREKQQSPLAAGEPSGEIVRNETRNVQCDLEETQISV
jgi:hypothetical protein